MPEPWLYQYHPEMVALRAAQADQFHDLAEEHTLERLALQKAIRRASRGEPS